MAIYFAFCGAASAQHGIIETIAGGGQPSCSNVCVPSGDGGPAASASFFDPEGIALDNSGNLYIADVVGSQIRKVTSSGIINTFAGRLPSGFYGDGGPAISAGLSGPQSVAIDGSGNIYISDLHNIRIRKVSSAGTITTFAGSGPTNCFSTPCGTISGDGGPAIAAGLGYAIGGLAVDQSGNVFIADISANQIRKIDLNGIITTVAGNGKGAPFAGGFSGDNGPATAAELNAAEGVAVDSAGNIYIADSGNGRVRKVSSGGIITTIAGNGTVGFSGDGGPAVSAAFSSYGPTSIAIDSSGNLFVTDPGNNRIRKISTSGTITTVAGSGSSCARLFCLGFFSGDGGSATSAVLSGPSGIAVDAAGNLYIADSGNVRIREVFAVDPSAVQTLTFGPLSNVTFGVAPLTLTAKASSGLPVTFSSATPTVCTVSQAIVTIVGGGVCSITASQTGSGFYQSAGATQSFTVNAAAGAPTVNLNGVVPVDSPSPVIQTGEWTSIYGTNLATTTASWNGDYPTTLGGVTVTVDGSKAYLSYVSPTQINLETPDDSTTGNVSVTVSTPAGTWTSTVSLQSVSPAFSLFDTTHVAGIIIRLDGTGAYGLGGSYDILGPTGTTFGYPHPAVAAKQGDIVVLFGGGFGPTSPPVAAGTSFSGAASATNPVQVRIGNTVLIPSFVGVGSPGVYQLNLTIPAGLGVGDLPLTASVAGASTQSGIVISLH